jgi:hypothetical protein
MSQDLIQPQVRMQHRHLRLPIPAPQKKVCRQDIVCTLVLGSAFFHLSDSSCSSTSVSFLSPSDQIPRRRYPSILNQHSHCPSRSRRGFCQACRPWRIADRSCRSIAHSFSCQLTHRRNLHRHSRYHRIRLPKRLTHLLVQFPLRCCLQRHLRRHILEQDPAERATCLSPMLTSKHIQRPNLAVVEPW